MKGSSDNHRFQILKQQQEYLYLRNRASNILNFVWVTISLIASLGLIQFLASGGAIQQVSLDLSDEAVNQCSPEAVTHSNVSLQGLGIAASMVAIGLLLLSVYLVAEMWMTNRIIQNQEPSLKPRNPSTLSDIDYREWVRLNEVTIEETSELLNTLIGKLHYSFALAGTAFTLFALLLLDQAYLIFILGMLLILTGFLFLGDYILRHEFDSSSLLLNPVEKWLYRIGLLTLGLVVFRHITFVVINSPVLLLPILGLAIFVLTLTFTLSTGTSRAGYDEVFEGYSIPRNSVFHLRNRHLSPVFMAEFTIVLCFLIGQYYDVYLLLDHLVFC